MDMRLRTILAALLVSADAGGEVRAAISSRPVLLGSWEDEPGVCEGDSHVTYRGDGALLGYDYEGRWVRKGAALVTTITRRMGADERWRPVARPERTVTTIVLLSRDRLIERWPDGSLHRQHRCR